MSERYGRVAIVNVDGKQIVTAAGANLNSGLRMTFKVEKSLKPAPNQAELRIWNLADENRKALVKDALVSIEAGYGKDTSIIFVGEMHKIDHVRSGPDWITHLRIADGEKAIKASRVSTSFKPGSTPLQIVKKLCDNFDIPAKSALDKAKQGDIKGALKSFASGYTASGRTWDELTKVGSMLGYDVSVQNGEVLLLGPDETDGPSAVLLSAQTGLLDSPEQAESSGEKKKHTVIKAKSLLNGELVPGRAVQLDSRGFKGLMRVEKVTVMADTHGNDWFCDLELKRVQ